MQPDRKTLDKILQMDDANLSALVQELAKGSGIPFNQLGLNAESLENLRKALQNATESDMEKLTQMYGSYLKNRRS